MKTKAVYGNCLFGAMFLYLRGRAKKFCFVSSHSIWVPAHVGMETKRGNIIHFKYIFPQNPLYFIGRFEGVRKSRLNSLLEREDRSLLFCINPHIFFILSIFAILILIIPWAIFWVVEPIWRLINGFFYVAKRRCNRLFNNYCSNNLGR